ncbi:hypothetical protein ZWY2020_059260 [Hordeum vulgare]|nr:hypothetical protein ZWY2020_059260 [Hordeum vulgare]
MKSPDDIIASINYHVFECRNLKKHRRTQKQASTICWSPPLSRILKINIDGALHELTSSGGCGFIVRNDSCVLMAAGEGKLEHVSNAFHAEALAMLYAISTTTQMGCNYVIFETDSMVLKQVISSKEYDLSTLGVVFQEIKFNLNVAFDDVNISVCPRSCNVAAHSLVTHGVRLGDCQYETWLGNFPQFLINSIAGDLASLTLSWNTRLFIQKKLMETTMKDFKK